MIYTLTKLIAERPWHLAAGLLWVVTVIASCRVGYKEGYNSVPTTPTISAASTTTTSAATAEVATEIRCPVTVVTVPAGQAPGTHYDTAVPVTSTGKVTVAAATSSKSEVTQSPQKPSNPADRGLNTISVSWTYGQDPTQVRSHALTYQRDLGYGISSHLTYRALDRSIAVGLGLSF